MNALKGQQRIRKSQRDPVYNLRSLLSEELKEIYGAEKAVLKTMPVLIKNSTSQALIDALNEYLRITEKQVKRLEEIFNMLQVKPAARKSMAMDGILQELKEILASAEKGVVRDAAIILTGQKIGHYEIATYGALRAFSHALGEEVVASLLEHTIDEEKEADKLLTGIAEVSVNPEAAETETELSPIALYNSRKLAENNN